MSQNLKPGMPSRVLFGTPIEFAMLSITSRPRMPFRAPKRTNADVRAAELKTAKRNKGKLSKHARKAPRTGRK